MTSVDFAAGLCVAIVVAILVRKDIARRSQRHAEWVSRAARTKGIVDHHRVVEGTFDAPAEEYVPRIVYSASNGIRYQIDGRTARQRKPAVGTEVDVAYDPASPSTAFLVDDGWNDGSASRSALGCFVIAFAVATLIAATLRVILQR
jgi:hypothetical protein